MRTRLLISLLSILSMAGFADAVHPKILIDSTGRDAIKQKIQTCDWAKQAYENLKRRIDPYVEQCRTDPNWLSSRLFMHWRTHYTTSVCRESRWIGGEGRSPVPTPRFGGARDWKTVYQAPSRIEDIKPYNDREDSRVWLYNAETKAYEWADPGVTGRMFEVVNERIIQVAADAAFVYWLTGDEDYARCAASVLWTYMHGFSYKTAPQVPADDRNMIRIIGVTSFEVIHEDIVTPLSLCYDFLHDYLKQQGKDVVIIQNQLKRMIDRVIEGGFSEGNWNLNQARIIAYGGLALEDNESYPDGKGRPYYVDIVLNAQLPTQMGLTEVIKQGYDLESAVWPEAPGYSFGTTKDIVLMASLVGGEPEGHALLADPLLTRAILAQISLTYPHGYAVGMGDTYHNRINTIALELLIAAARNRSDESVEGRLTAALRREIDSGQYRRSNNANLLALTHYVPQLKDISENTPVQSRTYYAKPLNILVQRNLSGNPDYGLAAAMYGTRGGHVHANGLTIELYGAGVILGADPGRGSSYWQPDHSEYYSQPPAHNTVIVNGRSNYRINRGQIAMEPELVEPAFDEPGISPNVSFTQASFRYTEPATDQQRTFALVRTGPKSGFYVDIFRSCVNSQADSFHDYLYHNIGQSMTVTTAAGEPLSLISTNLLSSENGYLKGYDYFKNEKSIDHTGDLKVTFTSDLGDGSKRIMDMWMVGQQDRSIFSVNAPADRAGRDSLPSVFMELPMPTVLVRQQGEAWRHPFVAVFEPHIGADTGTIEKVRAASVTGNTASLATCVVQGRSDVYQAYVMQSDNPERMYNVEGLNFQGRFGVVILREGKIDEIYMAHSQSLAGPEVSVASATEEPVNVSLRRRDDGWIYSATGSIKVETGNSAGIEKNVLPAGREQQVSR